MAIFIASTKSISRGKGQSAIASASYRAGEKLEDKRYGKVHGYSKRYGVMSADIILPSSLKDKKVTNFRDYLTAVKNKIDESFIANNKDLIHLVNHPKQEREQYNERLTAWFEFKEDIDQKRADFNQSIIPKLGGSAGEVGRMTRDIISSFHHLTTFKG